MSYSNFVPTFWTEKIMLENEKLLVLANLCSREYEGQIKGKGDTVKILGIGKVTIKSYTGGSIDSPETIEDTSVFLKIDTAKYFNVGIEDIDKAQSTGNVMDAVMSEAYEGMADAEDTSIGTIMLAEAGESVTCTAAVSKDNARTYLQQAKTKLRKNGVKNSTTICAAVTPEYAEKLEIKQEEIETSNSDVLRNGFEGKVSGIEIYVSNNLPTSSSKDVCFIFTKKRAVTHANQVTKVEAFRPESGFTDAVKGLNNWGTKVVRPKELVKFVVTSSYS